MKHVFHTKIRVLRSDFGGWLNTLKPAAGGCGDKTGAQGQERSSSRNSKSYSSIVSSSEGSPSASFQLAKSPASFPLS